MSPLKELQPKLAFFVLNKLIRVLTFTNFFIMGGGGWMQIRRGVRGSALQNSLICNKIATLGLRKFTKNNKLESKQV
jgi:hypothetical protein